MRTRFEKSPLVFARRVVTDFISMTPWPLEMAGAMLLIHYGKLFSSNIELSRDYRAICAQIMPGDAWGIFAKSLGYSLVLLGLVTWLSGVMLYSLRVFASILGLVVWGALVYSCWRGDIPFAIWELYAFYFSAQIYVAILLQARRRAHKDDD